MNNEAMKFPFVDDIDNSLVHKLEMPQERREGYLETIYSYTRRQQAAPVDGNLTLDSEEKLLNEFDRLQRLHQVAKGYQWSSEERKFGLACAMAYFKAFATSQQVALTPAGISHPLGEDIANQFKDELASHISNRALDILTREGIGEVHKKTFDSQSAIKFIGDIIGNTLAAYLSVKKIYMHINPPNDFNRESMVKKTSLVGVGNSGERHRLIQRIEKQKENEQMGSASR